MERQGSTSDTVETDGQEATPTSATTATEAEMTGPLIKVEDIQVQAHMMTANPTEATVEAMIEVSAIDVRTEETQG